MSDVLAIITNRLEGDGTLYPGMVPGGVYDRPVKAGKEGGSTPGAFYVDPADPAHIPRLRRTIAIFDGGEVDFPQSPPGYKASYPRVFYYVEASAAGKAALNDIDARVRWLLVGDQTWHPALTTGAPLSIVAAERSPLLDSEAFPGSLVCFRRFEVGYFRRD